MSDDDFDDAETGEGGAAELRFPPPRENPDLIGHESAEAAFLAAFNSGRLPHAWLIAGPRGIGKATLAFRCARFLLAQAPTGGLFGAAAPATSLAIAPEHPAFRLAASGAHPDLLTVERAWDPKRKKFRSEIVVDDTRAIASFLHLTPSQGAWRVVVVDGADDMNRNAANALLKVLEEPPPRAILLLTSESPGRLLPTVRSRCRMLHLQPLPKPAVLAAIARLLPELAPNDAEELALLANGSIGRALQLGAVDGLSIHRTLHDLLAQLPTPPGESLHLFAEKLARGEGEGFALLSELLPDAVAGLAKLGLGKGGDAAADPALRRLAARRAPAQWVEAWSKLRRLFAAADGIDLDKKAVVLDAFFTLAEASR